MASQVQGAFSCALEGQEAVASVAALRHGQGADVCKTLICRLQR